MRLTFRLVLSLVLGLALVSLAFSYYQVRADKTQLRKDLERRAEVLAESLEQNAAPLLEKGSHKQLQRMVTGLVTGSICSAWRSTTPKRAALRSARTWLDVSQNVPLPLIGHSAAVPDMGNLCAWVRRQHTFTLFPYVVVTQF